MPRTYPDDVRLRAVALAEVRSVPVASKMLGIPANTIERWIADTPPSSALQRAVDLALSELTGRIADGTIKGRDLTVAYGVLRDKLARYGKAEAQPDPPKDPEALLVDEIETWVRKHYPADPEHAVDCMLAVLLNEMDRQSEAAEPDPRAESDYLGWATDYLLSLGPDPDAWMAAERARRDALAAEVEARVHAARYGADVAALIEQAEHYLQETPE